MTNLLRTVRACRPLLVAPVAAVVLVTAAPVSADDETFLTALDAVGVATDDPVAAVAMGRSVCTGLDGGLDVPTVAAQLSAQHGLTVEQAGMVTGFAVAEYCDRHGAMLSGAG